MATVCVIVLTASRATVGIAGLGILLTFATVALGGLSQRLIGAVVGGIMVTGILAPVAVGSFENRFEQAPLSEDQYDERAAFNRAAMFMFHDHPAGVGLNHYVEIAKNFGYSERAGVAASEENMKNIVHNAYWLAAAETGYFGVISFSLMLITPVVFAIGCALRLPNTPYRALLFGSAVAILMCAIHSFYEWVIFGKEIQYLLAITIGIISAVGFKSKQQITDGANSHFAYSATAATVYYPMLSQPSNNLRK
jgi:hypothetical protein